MRVFAWRTWFGEANPQVGLNDTLSITTLSIGAPGADLALDGERICRPSIDW